MHYHGRYISSANDELMHYGVQGMKWGVRRYQNPDGTLTAEGKARYYVNGNDPSSGLTIAGRKDQKEFEKHFRKDWYKSYNRASDRMNRKLTEINKKYDGKVNLDTDLHGKNTQKYLREVHKAWTDIYTDELNKDFGSSISNGYAYMANAPFMMMYVDYIDP